MGIELIEYKDIERKAQNPRFYDPGAANMSMRVRGLDALFPEIAAYPGVKILTTGGKPATLTTPNGTLHAVFLQDPDGFVVEMLDVANPPADAPPGFVLGGGGFDANRIAAAGRSDGSADPFAWEPDRSAGFAERAALGLSHVLYEKSPGGIVASARRTARWRDEIETAAAAHGVDPDAMEGMVLLESAGRPEVIAGDDPEAASGLAQIVAGTGTDLLGMRVDLARSRAITKRIGRVEAEIAKAEKQSRSAKPKVRSKALLKLRRLPGEERTLRDRRAAIDERFDLVARNARGDLPPGRFAFVLGGHVLRIEGQVGFEPGGHQMPVVAARQVERERAIPGCEEVCTFAGGSLASTC